MIVLGETKEKLKLTKIDSILEKLLTELDIKYSFTAFWIERESTLMCNLCVDAHTQTAQCERLISALHAAFVCHTVINKHAERERESLQTLIHCKC